MRLTQNDIGVHFSLKSDKVVKTMIRWLGAFAKVCIYFAILFEVEFKVMIGM